MTLILEFEHKLIFYKPGILRYAMRQAGRQLCAAQSPARRHKLLSLSLRRGWAEAKAQRAALHRLQSAGLTVCDECSQQPHHQALQVAGDPHQDPRLIRDRMDVMAITSPDTAPSTALARRQLH